MGKYVKFLLNKTGKNTDQLMACYSSNADSKKVINFREQSSCIEGIHRAFIESEESF